MNKALIALIAGATGCILWLTTGEKPQPPVEAGGSTGESARVRLEANDPNELEDLVRDAMIAGNGVELVVGDHQHKPNVSFKSRKLSKEELAKAEKTTSMLIRLSRAPVPENLSVLEKEITIADQHYVMAVAEAAKEIIASGDGFVTKGLIGALQSDDEWHYWNMVGSGGDRIYAPVDLSKYPQVRSLRNKHRDLMAFRRDDVKYTWNGRSVSQRQRMIAMAKEAQEKFESSRARAGELVAKKKDGTITAQESAELDEMTSKARGYEEIANAVPRHYDPVTLDAK